MPSNPNDSGWVTIAGENNFYFHDTPYDWSFKTIDNFLMKNGNASGHNGLGLFHVMTFYNSTGANGMYCGIVHENTPPHNKSLKYVWYFVPTESSYNKFKIIRHWDLY